MNNNIKIIIVFIFLVTLIFVSQFLVIKLSPKESVSFKQNQAVKSCTKWHPGNYVLIDPFTNKKFLQFGPSGEADYKNIIWDEKYLEEFLISLGDDFKGVEIPVLWRTVEDSKGGYNFNFLDTAMRLAKKSNKKVFFLITERVFNSSIKPVPDYIYEGNEYGGGAFSFSGNGQVAAIWNNEVQKRFYELITKLGERYDIEPNFEGVIFAENALNISPLPVGASPENYLVYLKGRVEVAKQAFPNSLVFQGFNWGYENILPEHSLINGVGFHGPDLVPDSERKTNKKRIPAYDYYPLYAGRIPLASDVQSPQLKIKGEWGNFTLGGIYNMGNNTLKLNYIFWAALDWGPNYYNFSDVKSFIKEKNGQINNTACPSTLLPCCVE